MIKEKWMEKDNGTTEDRKKKICKLKYVKKGDYWLRKGRRGNKLEGNTSRKVIKDS